MRLCLRLGALLLAIAACLLSVAVIGSGAVVIGGGLVVQLVVASAFIYKPALMTLAAAFAVRLLSSGSGRGWLEQVLRVCLALMNVTWLALLAISLVYVVASEDLNADLRFGWELLATAALHLVSLLVLFAGVPRSFRRLSAYAYYLPLALLGILGWCLLLLVAQVLDQDSFEASPFGLVFGVGPVVATLASAVPLILIASQSPAGASPAERVVFWLSGVTSLFTLVLVTVATTSYVGVVFAPYRDLVPLPPAIAAQGFFYVANLLALAAALSFLFGVTRQGPAVFHPERSGEHGERPPGRLP